MTEQFRNQAASAVSDYPDSFSRVGRNRAGHIAPEHRYFDFDYSSGQGDEEDGAEEDEKWKWLRDALPWAALTDIPDLGEHPSFPGINADYTALAAFVDQFRNEALVYDVPCKLTMGCFSVAAKVNFLTMQVYFTNSHGTEKCDLSGRATLEFSNGHFRPWMRTVLVRQASRSHKTQCLYVSMLGGKLIGVTAAEISRAISALGHSDFPRRDDTY